MQSTFASVNSIDFLGYECIANIKLVVETINDLWGPFHQVGYVCRNSTIVNILLSQILGLISVSSKS